MCGLLNYLGNDMATRAGRMTVSLDEDSIELLNLLSDQTSVSGPSIIGKLLSSHLEELWEYQQWLSKQKKGSRLQVLGANLMTSYGPENLLQGIKRLDPAYQFDSENFEAGIQAAIEQSKREANDA